MVIFLSISKKIFYLFIIISLIIMLSNISKIKSKIIGIFFDLISILLFSYEILYFCFNYFTKNNNYLTLSAITLSIIFIIFSCLYVLQKQEIIDMSIKNNIYYYDNPHEYRTVVHEVGHLLCYGLIKNIPDLKVKIVDTKKTFFVKSYFGYVEHEDFKDDDTKLFMEWEMRMLLAGKEMEKFIFNDIGMGSSSDYQRWNFIANKYLELGFGNPFYINPKNKNQLEINYFALDNLKKQMENEICIFFFNNTDIIDDLIVLLNKNKILINKDIYNYLNKVIPTSSMIKIDHK